MYNRCNVSWAVVFVNYFNSSAASGSSMFRPRGVPHESGLPGANSMCENNDWDDGPLGGANFHDNSSGARNSQCAIISSAPHRSTDGAAPGYSSAQAMKASEETFAQTMPREMGFDYLGMSIKGRGPGEGRIPGGHFRALALMRFSDPRRPVRELELPFSVLLGTPIAVLVRSGRLWWSSLKTISTPRSGW